LTNFQSCDTTLFRSGKIERRIGRNAALTLNEFIEARASNQGALQTQFASGHRVQEIPRAESRQDEMDLQVDPKFFLPSLLLVVVDDSHI
jgi:hypothetical protein